MEDPAVGRSLDRFPYARSSSLLVESVESVLEGPVSARGTAHEVAAHPCFAGWTAIQWRTDTCRMRGYSGEIRAIRQ